MHTDKAIAEFNAWWDRQPFREFCDLFEDVKDQMRNVWLASRREQAVVLPPAVPMPDIDEDDDPDEFEQSEAIALTANGMRHACRAAIEAAGVTVRG